jgi:hypothetical protein
MLKLEQRGGTGHFTDNGLEFTGGESFWLGIIYSLNCQVSPRYSLPSKTILRNISGSLIVSCLMLRYGIVQRITIRCCSTLQILLAGVILLQCLQIVLATSFCKCIIKNSNKIKLSCWFGCRCIKNLTIETIVKTIRVLKVQKH